MMDKDFTGGQSTIERAARAMYDQVRPDWAWGDPDAELLRRMYRANVRAALTAMRTPEMTLDEEALRTWQGVIDAILRNQ